MKKKSILALILAFVMIFAVACGNSGGSTATTSGKTTEGTASTEEKTGEAETLIIGVSPAPHAALVELVKEDLAAEGVTLDIKIFDDYVTPNNALADGSIDANFFQHKPYFDNFIEENNLDLTVLGFVHIEPMAVYSTSVKSIEELPEGAQIIIPNDPTNGARALLLLEKNGLIKLDDNTNINATEANITENPKNLTFVAMEAASIPRTYGDAAAAVINSNYAIDAGLDPLTDGILIETGESPYANLVAVRTGEENQDKFQKLIKALNSDKVKEYIEKEFKGSIVPAF